MQAQGCKGKAKLAVLAHELLTLDVSQPTSSIRAARALQLQREASISAAYPRNRRRYVTCGASARTGLGVPQVEKFECRSGSRWQHRQPISRPYSGAAVAALETPEATIADHAAPSAYHRGTVRPMMRGTGASARGLNDQQSKLELSQGERVEDQQLSRLIDAVQKSRRHQYSVVEVMHHFLSLPDPLKLAVSTSELLEIFQIVDKALLEEHDTQSMAVIQIGLSRIPMSSLLDRFTRPNICTEYQDQLIATWMKVLVNAEMSDLADCLFDSATSRGLLTTLDTDLVVGPLVVLQEWSLVLKWTKGRVCSVGVHAMRMRALIALGQPRLALVDYKEHLQQLGTKRPILVEAMKSYYMTRDFANGNLLRKSLAHGLWTRTSEYALAQIHIIRYLGFTPLLEKSILGDLRRNGSETRHVPLLNVLTSLRVENKLDISPILAMYPRSRHSAKTASCHTIILDEQTLAIILEDRRHIADRAQLLEFWQHIQSHLLDRPISSHLVAALVKGMLRLDLAEEAVQLIEDIANCRSNIWVDRAAHLRPDCFNPLIGYVVRTQGFDASIPIFRLMASIGCLPDHRTLSSLINGLAMHLQLQSAERDQFLEEVRKNLSLRLQVRHAETQSRQSIRSALRNYALQREIELSSPETEGCQLSTLLEYKPSRHSKANVHSTRFTERVSGTAEFRKCPSSETIFSAAVANGFQLDVACCEDILRLYVAKADLAGAQELMGLSWQMGMIPSMEMWTVFVKAISAQDRLQSFEVRMDSLKQIAQRWRPSTFAAANSMTLAALTPDQATFTRIIKALIREGALRDAVRVWTYARSSMAEANQLPDAGILTVAIEALLRTGQTKKATELLLEAPTGYAAILRSARGTAKTVLRKALKRARAWYGKQQDDSISKCMDDFLKSIGNASSPIESNLDGSQVERIEARKNGVPTAGPMKHAKRSGFVQGELEDLRRQISVMFKELWPEEGTRTNV